MRRPRRASHPRAGRLVRWLGLALLGLAAPLHVHADTAPPERVVSMNLCTDQLAMLLGQPGQIAAISRIARDPVSSAYWREAEAYPVHSGSAEAIHAAAPDLVLAGAHDRAETLDLLRRLGHRIEVFPPAESFDEMRAQIRRMGALLGSEAAADAMIEAFDAGLATDGPEGPSPRAALYYANGYTSGAGTLADDVLDAAGISNIAADLGRQGLTRLDLELLLLAEPDLLVTGQDYGSPALAQGILRHPALRASGARLVRIPDSLWTCGTPRVLDAVRQLRVEILP